MEPPVEEAPPTRAHCPLLPSEARPVTVRLEGDESPPPDDEPPPEESPPPEYEPPPEEPPFPEPPPEYEPPPLPPPE